MGSVIEHLERAHELMDEAMDLDDGDERIAICEDALREAEQSGDFETKYRAREYCVRAYAFGGAPEKALVGFSWLLAQFDSNPGKFSDWSILWKYKWILGLICHFPQIPKTRIYEMLDDFEARSLRAGYGLHAVYTHRYRIEKFWDNRELALKYFQKTIELPLDELSNCSDCLRDEIASYAIYVGDDARGVEFAQSLLDGEKKCATVPHRTYGNLLLSMVRLGRQEEGLNYHRAGYRLIARNGRFVGRVAQHLIFLVLTENFAEAVTLFQKHYPWTEHNRDSFDLFHFFRASWLLFEVLDERGREVPRLTLPRSFPNYSEDGYYDAKSLMTWFKDNATDLATRFDERNETDFFMRTLRETSALKDLCAPFRLITSSRSQRGKKR